MSKKYTNEELLRDICETAVAIGKMPTFTEYENYSNRKYNPKTYYRKFKNWQDVVKSATCFYKKSGYTIKINFSYRGRLNKYSKEQVIHNIECLIQEYGRIPTMKVISKHPKYKVDPEAIRRYFKTIENLYQYFHMTYKRDWRRPSISLDEALKILYDAIISHPEISSLDTIMKKYCIKNQSHALLKHFANFSEIKKALHRKYGIRMPEKASKIIWTKDILLDELYRIQKMLGRVPTRKEFLKYTQYKNAETKMVELFKNYRSMLEAASLLSQSSIVKHIPNTPEIIELKKQNMIHKLREHCPSEIKSMRQGLKMAGISYNTAKRLFNDVKNLFLEAKINVSENPNNTYKDKDLITCLQKIASDLKHVPTQAEYKKHPYYLCEKDTFICRFGSWDNALKTAGLK